MPEPSFGRKIIYDYNPLSNLVIKSQAAVNRIKQSGKSFLSAFCRAASPRERPIYIEITA